MTSGSDYMCTSSMTHLLHPIRSAITASDRWSATLSRRFSYDEAKLKGLPTRLADGTAIAGQHGQTIRWGFAMTEADVAELRMQTHQNTELIQAMIRAFEGEFIGLRETIREHLNDRMREFTDSGWDGLAAANKALAEGPFLSGD